jgi:hypothetical protein
MALVLSGSIDISGSMTATTIIVSAPGVAGMVSSSAQITELAPLMAYTASLKGAIEVSGQNVNVLGTLTAQEIYTTYVTSSVMFKSGSTKFGDDTGDKHEVTGSLNVSGGLLVSGTSAVTITANTAGNNTLNLISTNSANSGKLQFGGATYGATIEKNSLATDNGLVFNSYHGGAEGYTFQSNGATKLKIGGSGRTEVTGSFNVNGEIRMDGSTLFRGMSSNTLQLCGGTSSSNIKINGASEEITMDTNGVTRTLIQSDGKILTGTDTSTPTTSFKFRYNASGSNDIMAIVAAGALASNTSYIAFRTGTGEGSYKADIRYETGALSFNNMSDFRFKENIVDAPSQWNKVKNSKLRIFDWKDKTANNQLGFIAQELYQTIPEAVGKGGDEEQYDGNEKKIWTIAETKLVPAMFGALQEAMAKIEELTARIESLENK